MKSHKKLKIFGIILASLVLFWTIINVIPPKKNIENNNFRIMLTKKGDYVYKLVNANGQLLSLGDHYKTKRLCKNAVETIRHYAMHSPMLTDENLE